MKLRIEDFRKALDLIGDSAGAEAAIVAQYALDLAIAAHFNPKGNLIKPEAAQKLLRLQLARHRAAQHVSTGTIH